MNCRAVCLTMIAGVVVLTSAPACTGRPPIPEPTGEPVVPSVGQVDVKTLVLPLDPYLVRGDRIRVLGRATLLLASECMRRFGFHLQYPSDPGPPLGINERRYLLADLARAQRDGYRISEYANRPPYKEPELSPEAQTLLDGVGPAVVNGHDVPAGGCLGEARRRLEEGAKTPADPDLAQQLSSGALQRARQDSRVKAAAENWSACMARQGYQYASPSEANDDPAFATERVSDREIAVATADVRCKQEVNYVATLAAVDAAYQSRALERNHQALEEIRRMIETQLRNAARLAGGG